MLWFLKLDRCLLGFVYHSAVAHARQEGLGWARAKLRLILLPCVTFFLNLWKLILPKIRFFVYKLDEIKEN